MIFQIFLYLFLSILTVSNPFSIDASKSFILDEAGRYKIFHGVNVVVKLPPYIPDTSEFSPDFSFTDEDIQILKSLGINLVRLGIIWESIESSEGIYNYPLLKNFSSIVSNLEKKGISVIIDAHQDMFSRVFCGEGTPKFYVDKLSYEKKCDNNILSQIFGLFSACIPLSKYEWELDEETGLPLIEECKSKGTFIDYHKSPELMSIYDSFFKNENNVLDSFAEFWKVVAYEFKGRKNVLGYDIWNEPWAANLWRDLKSLWPGYLDDGMLTDFYKKVNEGIEEVDPDYTLLFEPIPFPDTLPLFGGRPLGTFSEAPVDVEKRPQMFNVHSYCCAADQNICKEGEPSLDDATSTCPDFHERKIKKNKEQAEEIKVPLIVTEFGACGESDACYYEMLGLEKACDKYLTSWAYWMYKRFGDHTTTAKEGKEGIFNDDGTVQKNKERALARSYVQSFQGYPVKMVFYDETGVLFAEFIYEKDIMEPTVIYANKKLFYETGFDVKVTDDEDKDLSTMDDVEVEIDYKDDNYIFVIVISERNDLHVKISVSPKVEEKDDGDEN